MVFSGFPRAGFGLGGGFWSFSGKPTPNSLVSTSELTLRPRGTYTWEEKAVDVGHVSNHFLIV